MISNYPKYEAYKETGIEWLPRVPEGWEVKKLKYCCDKINPTKSEVRALPASTEVSFLPMESVSNKGNFDLSTNKPLSEVIAGFTYFKDFDILLAKITPCFENGKGCLVSGLKNSIGFGTTEFHVIRANKSILPEHLYNHTKTTSFMNIGESEMKGAAGQKRVPQEFIENFLIPLPPLPEQKAIADFLDEKTGKIDSLLEKLERQKELLTEKRTALITRAVTRGLNASAPMKETGIEWLPQVPKHWEVKRLKYFVSHIGSGKTPRGGAEVYIGSGIMLLRSQNIYDDGLRLDDVVYISKDVEIIQLSTRIHAGDVLLNITGASIGRTNLVPENFPKANVNQHVCIFRPIKNSLSSLFLYNLFCSQVAKEQILCGENGTSREGLNFEQAGNLLFTIPPLQEQKQIAEYLDTQTTKIDLLQSKTDKQIELLKEYRTALITSAVTGQIKVTGNQVRTDGQSNQTKNHSTEQTKSGVIEQVSQLGQLRQCA